MQRSVVRAIQTYNDGEAQQRTFLINGFMQPPSRLSRDGFRSQGRLGGMAMAPKAMLRHRKLDLLWFGPTARIPFTSNKRRETLTCRHGTQRELPIVFFIDNTHQSRYHCEAFRACRRSVMAWFRYYWSDEQDDNIQKIADHGLTTDEV